MTDPVLTADGATWVAAADAAATDTEMAVRRQEAENAPSYVRDILLDELDDDPFDPDEEWEAPYGPAVPPGQPVILVDVDGPLSPMVVPQDGDHWPSWVDHKPDGYDLPLAPAMGSALADLPAQLVFLTTWNEKANTAVAPVLGWPDLPVLSTAEGRRFTGEKDGWAKLHVLRRWLRTYGPRPLIWFDDDARLTHLTGTDPYLSALPHLLLLPVNGRVGLTREDVATMAAFLTDLPAG